jgi:hypothetical protein
MPLPDAYFQNEKALEQLYIKAENGCDVKDELLEISCKIFEVDVNDFKKLIFKKLS